MRCRRPIKDNLIYSIFSPISEHGRVSQNQLDSQKTSFTETEFSEGVALSLMGGIIVWKEPGTSEEDKRGGTQPASEVKIRSSH